MRLRRSTSTPSDTRPATSRRTTEKARRSRATAAIAPTSSDQVAAAAVDVVDRAADQERDEHARAHRGDRERE